jgi:hypothetical protein
VDYFGVDRNEALPLTAALRSGTTEFLLSYGLTPPSLTSPAAALTQGPALDASRQAAATTLAVSTSAASPASNAVRQDDPTSTSSFRSASLQMGAPTASPAVNALPSVGGNATPTAVASGGSPALAAGQTAPQPIAKSSGSGGTPPELPDTPVQKLLKLLLAEMERTMPEMAQSLRAWFQALGVPLPGEGNRPVPARPRAEELPMQPPPEEEAESSQEVRGTTPAEPAPEAEVSADCFVSGIGLGVCVVGLSTSGPIHRRRDRGRPLRHSGP